MVRAVTFGQINESLHHLEFKDFKVDPQCQSQPDILLGNRLQTIVDNSVESSSVEDELVGVQVQPRARPRPSDLMDQQLLSAMQSPSNNLCALYERSQGMDMRREVKDAKKHATDFTGQL